MYLPTAKAQAPSNNYVDYFQNTLTKNDGFDYPAYDAYESRQRAIVAKHSKSYGGSCVYFAKKYLGIYGTWGNGGRRLSLNSGPEVNAVLIFTYIHVAVVQQVNGNTLTIIESNYDLRGSIRVRTIEATDPTIRGFHSF